MIRPEMRAVESERATRERNACQVFHLWRFLSRIEARDAPVFASLARTVRLLLPAQGVDQSIGKGVPGDLGPDINDALNISVRIEFENALLVPLAQIQLSPVVAKIRAGKLRARNSIFSESARRIVAAQITVVVRTFTDGEPKDTVSCDCRPRNSGRTLFLNYGPRLHLD